MEKADRYEILYIKSTSFFSAIGIIYCIINVLYSSWPGSNNFLYEIADAAFFVSIILINIIKYTLILKDVFSSKQLFFSIRFVEIAVLTAAFIFLNIDIWVFSTALLLIMTTSLSYGISYGLGVSFFCTLFHFLGSFYIKCFLDNAGIKTFFSSRQFANDIFLYFVTGIFTAFCGMIYKVNSCTEQQNKKLVEELEEKYGLLKTAQQEIKFHYEKVKETNLKLEETNSKLSVSIGEFYTLQQISQAISSIFNIKELLKYVNDIIIGVMGVNYSTIIVYEDKRKELKVHTTNIDNEEDLLILNENINFGALLNAIDKNSPILENFVDEKKYSFTQNRGINSLICVPLATKTKKFGLVLVEHKLNNAFNDGNVRLLDIIAQQVSIAMENAELYQKMQELASIDGLTGVYNRLCFQQMLTKELKNAADNGYSLSITIFDVDYFKVFNDTYGHMFGDKVIRCIADIVKASLDSPDMIARYGGEEFIILFPKTELAEAYEKVEVLREKIASAVIRDEPVTTTVTASFGISCYPISGTNEIELLRKADKALYEAKASGRNCVKIAEC